MINYIMSDDIAYYQYDWFLTASDLTQVLLSYVNQPIEAFVYCILAAEVNMKVVFWDVALDLRV